MWRNLNQCSISLNLTVLRKRIQVINLAASEPNEEDGLSEVNSAFAEYCCHPMGSAEYDMCSYLVKFSSGTLQSAKHCFF